MNKKGLIHVYHGDGKGKTTAAIGLAVRAAGHGMRVCIIQFMKETVEESGEAEAIKKIENIDLYRFGASFIDQPEESAKTIGKRVSDGLLFAQETVSSGEYDMVILDEINVASYLKVADPIELQKVIDVKNDDVELVLTGRYPSNEILEKADLVTEMKLVKHPFEAGVKARKGIEF